MESEYAIKISLTKHVHDNPTRPYYWSLVTYTTQWVQVAGGWEASPTACMETALKYYQSHLQS